MTTSYVGSPRTNYVPAGSPGASYTGATGPSYDQEVQSYLDQTSPARIREQSQTVLPSSDYMAKAEHESRTNENSPARQRSYHGSPQGSPSGTHYVAPVTTSYVPSGSPHAAPVAYVSSGSPHGGPVTSYVPAAGSPGASYTGATGPSYDQEVQSYLDQTSPARIREQSQTVLPSSDYMAKAEHESRTNENSPTRQRSYHGSPQGSPSGTHYVAPVTTSYVPSGSPSYHSHPVQPTSVVYAPTEHIPLVAGSPAPSYHTATSPVPAAPAQGETHGESPRRLRAFGHPHVDPCM